MDGIYETALRLKAEKTAIKKEFSDKLVFTEQQFLLITQEMKEKIHHMVEDVEQRVSARRRPDEFVPLVEYNATFYRSRKP